MKSLLGVLKKYRIWIIIGIVIIAITYIGIDIYHRSLGNVDRQEERLREQLINNALKYRKVIEKDLKLGTEETLYIINDKKIVKRSVTNHKEEFISTIDSENDYGILLSKNNNYQYYLQSDDYCINQNNKKDELKVKKGICSKLSNEETIGTAIQKYSTTDELVADTSETGLDESKPYTSKLYFRGENPNNYLIYENACYRIMNITQNNSIKIIYEGLVNEMGNCVDVASNVSGYVALLAWDNYKDTDILWNEPCYLNFRMQDWIDMGEIDMKSFKVNINQSKLALADWYGGRVLNNETLQEDINDERSVISQAYTGLITPSEYNKISCKNSAKNSNVECAKENYLYKEKYGWWTMNRSTGEKKSSWSIDITGATLISTVPYSNEYSYKGIRPVFYLKNDLLVKGIGTDFAPYTFN